MWSKSELSECELATMKCIWDAKEPITCQEIMDQLAEQYDLVYKDTTVYTYLKNLKKKGFVDRYRRGVYFFFAIRDEAEYRADQLERVKKMWFRGNVVEMIPALLDVKKMTKKQKEEIKKAIDEMGN